MTRSRSRRFVALTAPLVALVAIGGLALGLAPRAMAHDEAVAHPVHIHSGSCAELGDVVAPLSDLTQTVDLQGTPVAEDAEAAGPETAIPVDISVTVVELALADIVAGGHAINAHESTENIQNYIACGDIGGVTLGDTLVIGLAESNGSGYSGVATLQDQGDSTLVTVYLSQAHAAGGEDAAEESPAADAGDAAASGEETAVEIADFAFGPDTVTIPVGTTVTWTNNDTAPHTATAEGGEFQSGKLDPGDSFSHTFETAGEFAYFCEFHANMQGTIVVE